MLLLLVARISNGTKHFASVSVGGRVRRKKYCCWNGLHYTPYRTLFVCYVSGLQTMRPLQKCVQIVLESSPKLQSNVIFFVFVEYRRHSMDCYHHLARCGKPFGLVFFANPYLDKTWSYSCAFLYYRNLKHTILHVPSCR